MLAIREMRPAQAVDPDFAPYELVGILQKGLDAIGDEERRRIRLRWISLSNPGRQG